MCKPEVIKFSEGQAILIAAVTEARTKFSVSVA